MNLQQIEYLVALNKHRSFQTTAKALYITQPALTIQIKNLEDELGVIIFDRTKKPIIPTEIGEQLIEQAQQILIEQKKLSDIVSEHSISVSGQLKLGIIPTVSPYLSPKFVNGFINKYPEVQLEIFEDITEIIIKKLKTRELDAGIIVTPIDDSGIVVSPLYYEKFYAYVSSSHPYYKKGKLESKDISTEDVWLLKEGNCFRNQVINLCSLQGKFCRSNFRYESSSVDSLIKIVNAQSGLTIIPEFAVDKTLERKMIKPFSDFVPEREVSLIVERTFLKKKLIDALQNEILSIIPRKNKANKGKIISI